MIIKEIENKDIWEGFLDENQEKSFLHSWSWGEFQKALGEKIWRLAIIDNDKIQGVALIIKVSAKRGTFFLCPHGPILKDKKLLKDLLEYLKELAKREKAGFIRFSPIWPRETEALFKDLGFRRAPIHIHPENNWILRLEETESELLMGMRKTTRNLIRRAIKDPDVVIEKRNDLEAVEEFNKIYQATYERQDFVPFSSDYLKKEFLAFENNIEIFLGKYKGDVTAGAMIIYWQNKGYYHQGASSREYPKIPVSHLLQWEALKEAKARGCDLYSFWGVAPQDEPKHPWQGITLFKQGFGGELEKYARTQDFVLSSKYWLNYVVEKLRSKKRGF